MALMDGMVSHYEQCSILTAARLSNILQDIKIRLW